MSLLVVWLAVRDRERERAERERAERERAERERERAELLSLVDSSERRLLSRVGRVLSEEAFVRAHRCVFALSWAKDGAPHGVGVLCGAPGSAVTAAHNLAASGEARRHTRVRQGVPVRSLRGGVAGRACCWSWARHERGRAGIAV